MFGGVRHDEVTGWVSALYTPSDDYDHLLELVGTASRLKNWADAAMLEYTRRAAGCDTGRAGDGNGAAPDDAGDGSPGADPGPGTGNVGGAGTRALLQGATKQSAREAAAAAKRAALVARAPSLGAALARGGIGSAHLDALNRTLDRATVAQQLLLLAETTALIETAKDMSPEQFQIHCDRRLRDLTCDDGQDRAERQRRNSYLRTWTDDDTGMFCGRFELDPERGDRLRRALDTHIKQLLGEQPDQPSDPTTVVLGRLGAQALCDLVGDGHATRHPNDADLHVLIDHQTLLHGLHEHSVCELTDGTQIPVGLARRLACNATIIPTVLGADGEVLDQGREQRLANRAQRRALRAMYRTCAIEGCIVAFDRCEIHHVRWWELLGPTDLGNLVPACPVHHHLVHEGGWQLAIAPNRDLTLIRPDGELHAVARFTDHSRAGRRPRTRTAPPGRPDSPRPDSRPPDARPPDGRRRPPPGHQHPPGHDPTPPHVAPTLFADAS